MRLRLARHTGGRTNSAGLGFDERRGARCEGALRLRGCPARVPLRTPPRRSSRARRRVDGTAGFDSCFDCDSLGTTGVTGRYRT